MTPKEIAKQYDIMVSLSASVHEGIATGERDEETIYFIKKNVDWLESVIGRDYWTTEDMTAVNKAIADGNSYLA